MMNTLTSCPTFEVTCPHNSTVAIGSRAKSQRMRGYQFPFTREWRLFNAASVRSPISVSGQEGKWISGSQPFFH
jgi:hypothetical protein